MNPNFSLALFNSTNSNKKIAQSQNSLCLSASVANHTE